MSSRRSSPQVRRFFQAGRGSEAEEARWPLRRLLFILVGVPIVAIAAFVALLVWAIATSCACTPVPVMPASPVEGVVVSVDAPSLGDVLGFQLRTPGGATYTLKLGTLENATQFSPSHLSEHEATSSPIRAWYRLDNGVPVVYRLEDASG